MSDADPIPWPEGQSDPVASFGKVPMQLSAKLARKAAEQLAADTAGFFYPVIAQTGFARGVIGDFQHCGSVRFSDHVHRHSGEFRPVVAGIAQGVRQGFRHEKCERDRLIQREPDRIEAVQQTDIPPLCRRPLSNSSDHVLKPLILPDFATLDRSETPWCEARKVTPPYP